jgi:hypothetical protein
MQYTIQAVSPETRSFQTQYGDMVSYKVKFKEVDSVVEISQKASTPAPSEGQTVNGTIDMSGKFGPKFKKEFSPGGFGNSSPSSGGTPASSGGGTTSKFKDDPYTMYLSYAKDVAVALINSADGFNKKKFDTILGYLSEGGKGLYDNRPGAEPASLAANTPLKDNTPDDDFDGSKPVDMSEIDRIFGTSKSDDVVDTDDVPFN